MTTQHFLEYDGYYTSAERLLEGVMFEVLITEADDGTLTIDDVVPPARDADYLKKINLPPFLDEIRTIIQTNIDTLQTHSMTMKQLLDEWEQETGEPRINLLVEI